MELDKVVNGLEKMLEDSKYNDSVNWNPWADTETLEAAIALLKAQEPRVMTLEEALGSEECWLERKDGNVTVADIALNGQDSGGYDVDSNELSTMRRYIFHSGYYGKYWRCWTSRPTDEQREATAWKT